MTVPIYHPPAQPPGNAVLEEEARILETEGVYHIGGKYIPDHELAARVRRLEAARRVENRNRQPVCAWCFERIPSDLTPVIIALRNVHPHCAKEFDAWIDADPEGWDTRWSLVTDDTLVDFNGETCRWGDLMLTDRKTVDMLADGRLVGGYPF